VEDISPPVGEHGHAGKPVRLIDVADESKWNRRRRGGRRRTGWNRWGDRDLLAGHGSRPGMELKKVSTELEAVGGARLQQLEPEVSNG
jgi:hypothetical protein